MFLYNEEERLQVMCLFAVQPTFNAFDYDPLYGA